MVIRLPIQQNGSIISLDKTVVEIEEELDKIYKSRYNYMRDYGKSPDLIIVNENDYLFFKHYFNKGYLYDHATTGYRGFSICGMKVLKMKAKGFVFAYE
jgi:hypothetical protein